MLKTLSDDRRMRLLLACAHRHFLFSAKKLTCKRATSNSPSLPLHTITDTSHVNTRYIYVSGTDLTEPATLTALQTSFMGFCTAAVSGRLASKDIIAAAGWVLVDGPP
jgi:hypothetical protein